MITQIIWGLNCLLLIFIFAFLIRALVLIVKLMDRVRDGFVEVEKQLLFIAGRIGIRPQEVAHLKTQPAPEPIGQTEVANADDWDQQPSLAELIDRQAVNPQDQGGNPLS